jgi:hypothetical protein
MLGEKGLVRVKDVHPQGLRHVRFYILVAVKDEAGEALRV